MPGYGEATCTILRIWLIWSYMGLHPKLIFELADLNACHRLSF